MAWYSGSGYEAFAFLNRWTGPVRADLVRADLLQRHRAADLLVPVHAAERGRPVRRRPSSSTSACGRSASSSSPSRSTATSSRRPGRCTRRPGWTGACSSAPSATFGAPVPALPPVPAGDPDLRGEGAPARARAPRARRALPVARRRSWRAHRGPGGGHVKALRPRRVRARARAPRRGARAPRARSREPRHPLAVPAPRRRRGARAEALDRPARRARRRASPVPSRGYLLQWYVAAFAWPLNVGNRPPHSAPAFIPVTFELGGPVRRARDLLRPPRRLLRLPAHAPPGLRGGGVPLGDHRRAVALRRGGREGRASPSPRSCAGWARDTSRSFRRRREMKRTRLAAPLLLLLAGVPAARSDVGAAEGEGRTRRASTTPTASGCAPRRPAPCRTARRSSPPSRRAAGPTDSPLRGVAGAGRPPSCSRAAARSST